MLIFFVVVVSLFGGVALCGLAVFLHSLYKSIKRLAEVAEAVHKLVEPMAGGNLLPEFLASFKTVGKTGKDIIAGLSAMTETVAKLNHLLWQGQNATQSGPAATAPVPGDLDINKQDSWFKAPTEVEQTVIEQQEEARAAGMPVNENDMPGGEPPMSTMVGADV